MPSADLSRRLNQAVALIQTRRPEQIADAHAMLLELSRTDPNEELVWLWLATASTTVEERVRYLKRVIMINPNNTKARAALSKLNPEALLSPLAGQNTAAPAPFTRDQIEQFALILAGIGALVIVFLTLQNVVVPRLFPTVTATPTLTLTPTHTASMTPTLPPTETPGGPSPTPLVQGLVPSWTPTPSRTPRATNTPSDTDTPIPTNTPRPTRTLPPSPTPLPSLTPFPTDTPNVTVTVSSSATIEPTTESTRATQPVSATMVTRTGTVGTATGTVTLVITVAP